MRIVLAADEKHTLAKEQVKKFLTEQQCQVIDVSATDIFTATIQVVGKIKEDQTAKGIVIDGYGVAPFMIANKQHGIICAAVYDDYTAKMTRRHNATQIIALGAAILAPEALCSLALDFVESEYDGGRHQVRIDMLNKML